MLLGYEYELVDESENVPKSLPEINRNDLQMVCCLIVAPKGYSIDYSAQARPLGDLCYMKFRRVIED